MADPDITPRNATLGSHQGNHLESHSVLIGNHQRQDNRRSGQRPVAFTTTALIADATENDARVNSTPNRWIVDSGASKHISTSTQGMKMLRPNSHPNYKVLFANGQTEIVDAVGAIVLNGKHFNRPIELKEVLIVTKATSNLFSVLAATQNGANIHFQAEKAIIQCDDQVIAIAPRGNDGVLFDK